MLQDFDYNPGEVDGMAYWEFDWANSAHTKMYYIVKKGTDAFDVIETEGFMHDAKDKRVVSSGNHTRIVTELLHLNSKIVLRASRSADADPDVA